MKITRTGKYYYLRLLRLKGTPHSLALGAAIGVFVGITPTIPLHTVIIIVLTLLTRSSLLAGIIVSWLVCNPLTYIPQYYLSLVIGNLVTPYNLDWQRIKTVLDTLLSNASIGERISTLGTFGYEAVIVLVIGGCLLALPFGVASYYLVYYLIVSFRKKKREKRILH